MTQNAALAAPKPKELTQYDVVRNTLTAPANLDQLRMSLPAHITPEKFTRLTLTALEKMPKLLECDRASLFLAIKAAAQDGLLPDGREAAIIPRGGKAAYQPMVAGILKKVRNSGELSSINAMVVHEKDEFDYFIDEMGEHLRHRPFLGSDPGKDRLTYAIARTKDGGVYVEVVDEAQMKAIENVSQASSGPWKGDFRGEMKRKSALRRLSKRLPMSTDIEAALTEPDPEAPPAAAPATSAAPAQAEVMEAAPEAPAAPAPAPDQPKASRLQDAVGAPAAAAPAPAPAPSASQPADLI